MNIQKSKPIRILFALYLAVWSPLWCCCTTQAAIEGSFGHAGERDSHGCCEVAQPDRLTASHHDEGGIEEKGEEGCNDDGDCDCGSHDQVFAIISSIQFHPGAMSGPAGVSFPAIPPTSITLPFPLEAASSMLGGGDHHSWGRAARTLYAQRQLLLI